MLVFDEADALFGARSEIKESHDRYANVDLNYLFRQIENYRGLAIFTTNRPFKTNNALRRRFRFVLEFPLPHTNSCLGR